jgi:nucleoid-associated protein YgaU
MGLIAFMKEAGEKLFGRGEAKAAQEAAAAAPTPANVDAANAAAAGAIKTYIETMGLPCQDLAVKFDGNYVTVSGCAPDQSTKEKIILSAGNVDGVLGVYDDLSVTAAQPESQYHTVVKGDNLSKIAAHYYGNASKYPVIFEANKPMLSHPDKIYPGQVLRIPPAS